MPKSRTEFQIGLDGELTKQFNNQLVFRNFLIGKVKDLTNKLAPVPHVKFFVKGGTALRLLKLANNLPDNSPWSDWDTQIIINPSLSPQAWYVVFRQVQRIIITNILEMQIQWENLIVNNNFIATVNLTANNTTYNNIPIAGQINSINTLSTPILHPLQTFDNVNNVLGAYPNDFDQTFELTQLSKELRVIPNNAPSQENAYILNNYFSSGLFDANSRGLLASQNEINNIPARMNSDANFQHLNENQKLTIFEDFKIFLAQYPSRNFTHSSFTANSLIEDFYLYRMVVRYSLSNFLVNGTPSNNQAHKVPLRAELLDVSIPRRDTAEAIHQYSQINLVPLNIPQNLGGGIIWIPDWVYQVQENIVLIVEVIEGRSGSPDKIEKRITRGFEALNNMNNNVIQNTVQKLMMIAPNVYEPWLIGIRQHIGNNLPLVLILMLLLDSLEDDFKIGTVIPQNISQQLTVQFNNLIPSIINDFNSVVTIPPNVVANLTDQHKAFVGTVQFSRRVTKNMFAQAVNVENLRYISEISTAFNHRGIQNVLGPQLCALLVMQHLEYTPSIPSRTYIYPYFDIFISPLSSDNQVDSFNSVVAFLRQNGFTVEQSPGPQSNNSVYILTKNGVRVRMSHNNSVLNGNFSQVLNGRTLLKNNIIVSELNNRIANSKNTHVVHWLDGLRNDFKKALTSF